MAQRLEIPGDATGIVTQRKPRLAPTIEPTNEQPGENADRLAGILRRRQAKNAAAAADDKSERVPLMKEKVG